MSDDALLEVFRRAQGCYGSTLHYLTETAASLERFGILDREVQRLVELARRTPWSDRQRRLLSGREAHRSIPQRTHAQQVVTVSMSTSVPGSSTSTACDG